MKKVTRRMLDDLPVIDIHVHLPGTISAKTAFDLGVRNRFFSIRKDDTTSKYYLEDGPESLSIDDPHEHYSDIFVKGKNGQIDLDSSANPISIKYQMDKHSFKCFDRIMATVQGHRFPPGGIQNENDLLFVFDRYLEACIKQNVFYTELQQNIRIAYHIYKDESKKKARAFLYRLFKRVINHFEKNGVHLRFLHCFNKTQAANVKDSVHTRTLEAADWIIEANSIEKDVFVGLESAGHEKDESGWPIHLRSGYEKVAKAGFGCEAHGGEGIGVEHMIDILETLPITRLAHGFQVIEDKHAIDMVIKKDITLIMMPIINLSLGACYHYTLDEYGNKIPTSKTKGGERIFIHNIDEHPFFYLLRNTNLKIAISSDNPEIGGVAIKEMLLAMSGLHEGYMFSGKTEPITPKEIYRCMINGINAAFCSDEIKTHYKERLNKWALKYEIL